MLCPYVHGVHSSCLLSITRGIYELCRCLSDKYQREGPAPAPPFVFCLLSEVCTYNRSISVGSQNTHSHVFLISFRLELLRRY